MESPGNDRRDFARAIYEMHIRQWRDIERGRLCFAVTYIIVTVATLLAWGENIFLRHNWPAILFLLALAKIGYLLSFHQAIQIESHKSAARFVIERYSLTHYWPADSTPAILRLMPLWRLFPVLYLFAFCFFLMTLLYILTGNVQLSLVAAILVYGIVFVVTMVYRPGKSKSNKFQ